MGLDFAALAPSYPFILRGIWVTLQIVAVAAVLGFLFGVILSLMKIGRFTFLRWIADAYTSVFRGTPLVLQLMIIYFGLPQVLGIEIAPFVAAFSAFALNSAAYVSEIIRAGINAVDQGQKEAAQALGISYGEMMKDIILPQAMKNILPALMNEFITLTKESAIVTTIGVMDIMRRAYIVGGETFSYFEPLLFAGFIYYCLVMVLTVLGRLVERRLRQSD
ncbi:amino acid ABC transporter permease [Alkalicoccus chagannorensis]|uniref:amino acid ABC transporter permease n=1 Tax=Alkalicoccus chagannorensis TaxID=427072 RepID=UPI0004189AD0|nr:amino acid ABC transporter permease [Alkalicoccus chagannorensis]